MSVTAEPHTARAIQYNNMNRTPGKNQFNAAVLLAASLAFTFTTPQSHAQSADALIDKLVDKGILTANEAKELRDEADKNFNTALQAKTGMPDWVTGYKISGDVRGRLENFSSPNRAFAERNRLRYRLRAGMVISMTDNFEAGFRLTSDDTATGGTSNEGDPISGNTTLQNNASKKLLFIDQAYGKWTPFNGPFSGGFTVGKMENPFVLSDLTMDPDYTPEGLAAQFAYQINNVQSVKLNAGGFVLDEIAANEKDPWLAGIQARWDAVWNAKWSSSVGAAFLPLISRSSLTNGAVPNQQRGNTRNGATGSLAYQYEPLIVDASVTYLLDNAPLYTGAFPIKFGGEFVHNPGAPSAADNHGWSAGVTFGKSGKRRTWELAYTYKWLGANSCWEELSDSDFGAFYGAANSPASSGAGIGYGSGPNTQGHVVKLAYSLSDSFTLSAKWFGTELIRAFPAQSDSEMNRVQVDAVWKF
jgi:hypothetical protein